MQLYLFNLQSNKIFFVQSNTWVFRHPVTCDKNLGKLDISLTRFIDDLTLKLDISLIWIIDDLTLKLDISLILFNDDLTLKLDISLIWFIDLTLKLKSVWPDST